MSDEQLDGGGSVRAGESLDDVYTPRKRSRQFTRLGLWSGVVGSLIGLTAVALASVLSPTFSWLTHEISDLGATSASAPWLLNGGLLVSGLVALPFAGVLYRTAVHPLQRIGAVCFGLTLLALSSLGVFPVGTPPHLPLSVAFFSLGTITLLVYGTGTALGPHARDGLVSLWLGVVHMLLWLLWSAGLGLGPGLAIPELLGTLLFFTWILRRTVVMSRGR